MKLDLSRLVNVKRLPDKSIQCQCPICALENRDKVGKNHLRIYANGAFSCIVNNERDHNRRIRAFLRATNPDDNPDIIYIDPEPRISIEKVYPEDTLNRLTPIYDYWLGRGAKESVIKELEGGLAPLDEKSKLAGRFIFPIRGRDNRIMGFTGRLIEENSFAPKWKILGRKNQFIFPRVGICKPAIKSQSKVILVESVGCVIALAGMGIWNTMCLFG